MRRLAIAAAIVVASTVASAEFVPTAAYPPIWPHPKSFTNGTQTAYVMPNYMMMTVSGGSPADVAALGAAYSRFTARTFVHTTNRSFYPTGTTPLDSIQVTVSKSDVPLQMGVPEDYVLSVPLAGPITIDATSIYGVYHALESLSQLTGFDFDTQTYQVRGAPWSVDDAPRFPHRGVLVDSSRHFQPLASLYEIIDSLSYAKFNLMHWHLTDAIAFPFDSPSYPKLAKYGAYSANERYTPGDVQAVVAYAKARGIRVMVEVDTPGHSGSFCAGMPEICPQPLCSSANINNWALDITKNLTYEVVGGILKDVERNTIEDLLHIGGDEVEMGCWSRRPYIMEWLQERGLTLNGGYEYYLKRIQEFVWANLNRQIVGWQEIWLHFGTQLDKRTIIHQWLPDSTALPLAVTSAGYRLIWSDSSVWYLDHLDVTWQQMYQAEPCNGLPASNCELVLGGEAVQFGETVDTSDALQTIWPRAAAIAERLWSPRTTTDLGSATGRIVSFRCLLNQRGIQAAPVDNTVARSNPPNPGSCYWQ